MTSMAEVVDDVDTAQLGIEMALTWHWHGIDMALTLHILASTRHWHGIGADLA